MSQGQDIEEGRALASQLSAGNRERTSRDVVSEQIQRAPDSGVEVQGRRRNGEPSTHIVGKFLLHHGKKILSQISSWMNTFLVMWFTYKLSVEPLFLYYYVIDSDQMCLVEDVMLGVLSIYFNWFNLATIIGSLFSLLTVKFLEEKIQRIICSVLLLIDLCSHLPGQSLLSLRVSLLDLESSDFYISSFYLFQYFGTAYLLYVWFTRAIRSWDMLANATSLKVAFNLLLYIHGGHVFGGLWYSFAVIKQNECWKKACKHYPSNCSSKNFPCPPTVHIYPYNEIKEFCSTKTQNSTTYAFGIYHEAIESGIVEMKDFPKRILHCFRWGLQNLSGYGQNLKASTDARENIFLISIAIYGVVLFVLFIGNMQIYLQLDTKTLEKMRSKKKEIEGSMSFAMLSKNLQKQIKKDQLDNCAEAKNVEFENLFNNVSENVQKHIKDKLRSELRTAVGGFESLSAELLEELCDRAKAVSYPKYAQIVQKDNSVDKMLFLVHGKLWICSLTNVDSSFASTGSSSTIVSSSTCSSTSSNGSASTNVSISIGSSSTSGSASTNYRSSTGSASTHSSSSTNVSVSFGSSSTCGFASTNGSSSNNVSSSSSSTNVSLSFGSSNTSDSASANGSSSTSSSSSTNVSISIGSSSTTGFASIGSSSTNVSTSMGSSSTTHQGTSINPVSIEQTLEDGQFCGKELIDWFRIDPFSSKLPTSDKIIQTLTKVDAFALMSYDLQYAFIKQQRASTSTQGQAQPPAESQPQTQVESQPQPTAGI